MIPKPLHEWPPESWPEKTRRLVEGATRKPVRELSNAEYALLQEWLQTPMASVWVETGCIEWSQKEETND